MHALIRGQVGSGKRMRCRSIAHLHAMGGHGHPNLSHHEFGRRAAMRAASVKLLHIRCGPADAA